MADKDNKKQDSKDAGGERFDPKPVQLGGESLVDRLLPHKKKIMIGLGLGFAVWGVIAVYFHFRDKGREKATDKLAAVIEVSQREVRPEGEAPDPKDPKAKDTTYKTQKERAEAVLSELASQGTDKAGGAYKASMLVSAGKLDEAIAEYRGAQGAKGLDGVLAREGLGLALEMKAEAEKDAGARQKGLEEALSTFQAMQPDEAGPRRAYALYHQGRILALLGKRDDAKAAFVKAKELGKDGELPEMIDERLAILGAS